MYCTMESTYLVLQGRRQLLQEGWRLRPSRYSYINNRIRFLIVSKALFHENRVLTLNLFLQHKSCLSMGRNSLDTYLQIHKILFCVLIVLQASEIVSSDYYSCIFFGTLDNSDKLTKSRYELLSDVKKSAFHSRGFHNNVIMCGQQKKGQQRKYECGVPYKCRVSALSRQMYRDRQSDR